MPGGDRTGPQGMGPRTGRAAGFCAGYDVPGFMNPQQSRWGGTGRAGGRGMAYRHGQQGGAGWGHGRGRMAFGLPPVPTEVPPVQPSNLEVLEARVGQLQTELSELRQLIGSLKPVRAD
jgi:hypothetical protein